MHPETDPNQGLAAYLCFHAADNGGDGGEEWAALLVVGPNGLPQEFLYSGPLRPTPVQSILYQEQLLPQVRISLVRSLLRGLRSRPGLFVARAGDVSPELLAELKLPVFLLGEDGGWMGSPAPEAEATLDRLEEVVGREEPMGRAVAALAYVAEYEGRPRSE